MLAPAKLPLRTFRVKQQKDPILPLVVMIASNHWRKSGQQVDYHDVLSEGLVGLFEATKTFKKGKAAKFSTYAYFKIKSSVQDMLRKERNYSNRYEVSDMSERLDLVTDDETEIKIAKEEQIQQMLQVVYRELPAKYTAVLTMYYLEGFTERQIAKKMKWKPSQIWKIKNRALLAAREALRKRSHYDVY